jgi:hypothetical protein
MKRCTCLEAFGLRRTIEFHPTPQFGMEWATCAFPKIFRIFFSNTARDPYGTGAPPWQTRPPSRSFPKKSMHFRPVGGKEAAGDHAIPMLVASRIATRCPTHEAEGIERRSYARAGDSNGSRTLNCVPSGPVLKSIFPLCRSTTILWVITTFRAPGQ